MSLGLRLGLLLALLLGGAVQAAPPSLEFAGCAFYLADARSAGNRSLAEYLPKGQTFEDYSHLLAVRHDAPVNLEQYANLLKKDLTTKYPGSTFAVLERTETTLELEFLIASEQGREYNLWHFQNTPQGLVSLQFVVRNRGDLARGFDTALEARPQWHQELKARAPALLGLD